MPNLDRDKLARVLFEAYEDPAWVRVRDEDWAALHPQTVDAWRRVADAALAANSKD